MSIDSEFATLGLIVLFEALFSLVVFMTAYFAVRAVFRILTAANALPKRRTAKVRQPAEFPQQAEQATAPS
jgi:hypothetical protein